MQTPAAIVSRLLTARCAPRSQTDTPAASGGKRMDAVHLLTLLLLMAGALIATGCGGGDVPVSQLTYTVGGTITGLGANTGLVLLNNNTDGTQISAGATTFAMNTRLGAGTGYQITIGASPNLHCRVR